MIDPSDAVDAYLAERFKVGLEQVLVDASSGQISAALAGAVEVNCRERNRFRFEDRGTAIHCDGETVVECVGYRFRMWVFQEPDGSGS